MDDDYTDDDYTDDYYMNEDNYHVPCQHGDCEREVPEEEFSWLDDEGAWKLAREEGWIHMEGEPPWMWLCPKHAVHRESAEEALADAQAHFDKQRTLGARQALDHLVNMAVLRGIEKEDMAEFLTAGMLAYTDAQFELAQLERLATP